MAACSIQGLGLVLAIAHCVAGLGCELVIGDEGRTVVDGGDAGLPDAVPPGAALPNDGAAPSDPDSEPSACVEAQLCIETAMACAGVCAEDDNGCVGIGPMKGCPMDIQACKMMCFMQCVACARCPTAGSACTNATR